VSRIVCSVVHDAGPKPTPKIISAPKSNAVMAGQPRPLAVACKFGSALPAGLDGTATLLSIDEMDMTSPCASCVVDYGASLESRSVAAWVRRSPWQSRSNSTHQLLAASSSRTIFRTTSAVSTFPFSPFLWFSLPHRDEANVFSAAGPDDNHQ